MCRILCFHSSGYDESLPSGIHDPVIDFSRAIRGGGRQIKLLASSGLRSKASKKLAWSRHEVALCLLPAPCSRWKQHVPPQHQEHFNGLHGIISYNLEHFIYYFLTVEYSLHQSVSTVNTETNWVRITAISGKMFPKMGYHCTIKNAVFWDVMPCGSCKNHMA
jgi:hypothetical protein